MHPDYCILDHLAKAHEVKRLDNGSWIYTRSGRLAPTDGGGRPLAEGWRRNADGGFYNYDEKKRELAAEAYISLKAKQGALDYDRRHYDSRNFTRSEMLGFLYQAKQYRDAIKAAWARDYITDRQAAGLWASLEGLDLSKV